MQRGRGTASIVASPVLVGAVTTLIVIVSVFLAYNANKGLPFVPTYDLQATLPNGSNMVEGNEVRIGGEQTLSPVAAFAEPPGGVQSQRS